MMSPVCEVTFRVKACTRAGESVCVAGDCVELGNWRPHSAKPLHLQSQSEEGEIWTGTVRVPADREVSYRYLIGRVHEAEDSDSDSFIMVRCWETNITPRKFSVRAFYSTSRNNREHDEEAIATFGHYNGRKSIDRGWLSGQTEIRLRLISNPIQMWKPQHKEQKYRVKCTPMDLRYRDATIDYDNNEDSHDLPIHGTRQRVEVSELNGLDDEPKEQNQFGLLFEDNGHMVFRAQTFEPEFLGYLFDFYVERSGSSPSGAVKGNIPKHVGYAYVLPVNLKDSSGTKTVPISGLKHRPIGQLTVDYLIIKPVRQQPYDLSISFMRHWKRSRRPLDVGHRGMGNSHSSEAREFAAVRENTIASLAEAGGHGADFVEFDVQLSKDKVAVIYHDFKVCLTMRKKKKADLELFEIPVKDLSLAQLQMLKIDHVSEKQNTSTVDPNMEMLDPTENQPFPTLAQVFQSLDPHIGFYIEMKYPQLMKTGEMEDDMNNYFPPNDFTDIILDVIYKHAGNRRIILSCFSADICTMLVLKQNKYPVLLLHQGHGERYPMFKDRRAQDIILAGHYARSENLLGISVHAPDLLQNAELIQQIKDMGLILFCWGEENNNSDAIKRLKQAGVDGVIYDRISEFKSTKDNVFKLEYEAKTALLREMGVLENSAPSAGQSPKLQHSMSVASSSAASSSESACSGFTRSFSESSS